MYEVIFLSVLALIYLVFASIQDWKSKEVANWLCFSLIIFALGFRFFYSFFGNDFMFFYQGLIGLIVFFILGNLLYYGRMFAGGDAKLMIAMGAILPFSLNFYDNVKIFTLFILIFLFVGALYGMISGIVLSFKNFKKFGREFEKRKKKSRNKIYLIMVLGLILMVFGFTENLLFFLGFLIFIMPYFYLYAKSVDEACLVKVVSPNKLVEGDWIYENIKIGRKTIKANWEGLSKEDILVLKKRKKKVKVRCGIAFVPVFLISFLILIYFWNTGLGNFIW